VQDDTPALSLRGVTKRYVNRLVLDGLDLDLARGEVVVVLAPNGTGKSTLLGCIAGTVVRDAGSISIAGHSLTDDPIEARRALRYLPQEIVVPPGVTGAELLAFHADVFGDRAGFELAVNASALGEALDYLATTYSVGMRKRLALACLLPGRASLFVLDEPFAGLDRQAQRAVVSLLGARLDDGAAILMCGHDEHQPEAHSLPAKIVWLNGGKLA